jgi:hypothetical protein
MKDQVMRNLVDIVSKNATEANAKKIINKVTGHTFEECQAALKEGGVTINDTRDLIAFNVHVFIHDTNLTEARAASFIRRLKEFGIVTDETDGSTSKGDVDPGVKATKAAQEAVADIYSILWQLSDVIKATKFIQTGGDINDKEINKDESMEVSANVLEEGLKNVFRKML